MKNVLVVLCIATTILLFSTCSAPGGGTSQAPAAPGPPPQFGTPTNIAVVQDGYPSLAERTSGVYVNAARMAPTDYRAKCMGGVTGILGSYPAVKPVVFNYDLNRAARFHSIDCTTNHCFQHNSYDGTFWVARIASFLPGATVTGEVMAQGVSGAMNAVNMILNDGGAADHSAGDGYRAVIMDTNARQLGAGFDGTMWTIDFVSNTPAALPPIVSACHDFVTAGQITFWLNYYDAGGSGPKKISCFVDGAEQALTFDMGSAAQGTYRVMLTKSSTTRAYYFLALDNAYTTWRYPSGTFMTVGEGTGTTDYVP